LDEHKIPLMAAAHRNTLQFLYRYWANSDELAQDFEMYGEFTDEFALHHLKRELWAAGLTEFQAADLAPRIKLEFEERFHPETLVADDVRPTLKTLRTLGYTMGLVSNRSSPFQEEIEQLGFLPFFDFYFTAGEINYWKPSNGFFEHALYLAESCPEETAYIGDNFFTDVVGAQTAGIYPILYDPRNTFPDAECQVITKIGSLVSQM